jgi:hypothetical protein
MRNKLSALVFVHADVEAADCLSNSSRLQGDSDMTPETLKHCIWIEVSLSKSMLSPDEAYDVPLLLSQDDGAGGADEPTLERP